MSIANQIWEFGKAHYGVFLTITAWAVREWTTFGGANGLWSWLKTGKISTAVPKPQDGKQQQQEQK